MSHRSVHYDLSCDKKSRLSNKEPSEVLNYAAAKSALILGAKC